MTLPLHKQLLSSARLRDRARVAFLAFTTLEIFVLPPMFQEGLVNPAILGIAPSLTLAAGVVAVSDRWSYAIVAGGIAVLALAARLLVLFARGPTTMITNGVMSILAVGTLFVLLIVYVFAPGRATWHRLVGAVVAYLLLAVMWARAFEVLRIFNPHALDLPEAAGDFTDLIYFSFATLTTLGYGLPVGPIARSMVSVEAVMGQMYLAILIARLVSAPPSSNHHKEPANG
jgi:hypothetical protein